MRLRIQLESLKKTTPMEYASRFAFGGFVTVVATLIANHWGPVIGGIFLAFPGIFPAGVSLVEKHKKLREAEEDKDGTMSALGEASVEATGASAGAIGLAGFALVLWKGLPFWGIVPVLMCAGAAWAAISWMGWWARERI